MADIRIVPASSIMSFTSSLNFIEKITQDASGSLNLYGSGSTGRTEILSVDGNNGRLFSVSDDLSDSLFSVNTIAGLPVIEAFANNTVVLGQYGQNVLVVTGSKVGIRNAAPSYTLDVSGSTRLKGNIIGSTYPSSGQSGGSFTVSQTEPGAASANVFDFNGISDVDADGFGRVNIYAEAESGVIISAYNVANTTGSSVNTANNRLNLAAIGGAPIRLISSRNEIYQGGLTYEYSIGTSAVNGEIVYYGGGSVTAGNLYYYDSSGNWTAADADAASTATGMLGIAQATGTASTVGMLVRGHARFTGNGYYTGVTTIGAPLYVSTTAGGFSQTAPSGTGDIVRIIGYVQSTANDQIYFCPDTTWVELV